MSRQTQLINKQVNINCIVPALNEASGIQLFLTQLSAQLAQLTTHYQIILLDDGSQDNMVEIAKPLLSQIPLKIVCFSRHFGKEMALTAGLQQVTSGIAILLDADFQHPFELLPQFLEKWAEGYDMVYGVQQNRPHDKSYKKIFSQLFYRMMRRIANINLPANAGDFRLLDSSVITALNQCQEHNRFMKGLYCWVGFKSIGIPFIAPPRQTGQSGWQFRKLTALALTGIISFSDVPLRVWGWIGCTISSLSFAYALYVVIRTVLYGIDTPGYATLIVAVMFLGGIQLLSIGILGEYIARIFNEVKRRPPYIIAKIYDSSSPPGST